MSEARKDAKVRWLDMCAELLDYPGEDYIHIAEECGRGAREFSADSEESLNRFCNQLRGKSLDDLEERYVRTFDINPECSLEVGWRLYGEEYTRGTFLAWMRRELRSHGIVESKELPDHLTHALRLVGRMDESTSREFTAEYLIPAMTKMTDGFKDSDNPYGLLLSAIKSSLLNLFGQALEVSES
jgi:nitrate reductase delta subunit